jgi:hypothetical protein
VVVVVAETVVAERRAVAHLGPVVVGLPLQAAVVVGLPLQAAVVAELRLPQVFLNPGQQYWY